ncbi:Flp family type IVb pilin [Dethiobacter alkaliphilus]|uniref:Flp/Fap pilin component n=1 Tax=Dethiobacter alkaliphilus AHT 1 TaxID=555088 RepID=C0GKL3_DETAL|nr:Flp family type IVb pilin [Dethiobacter alkaliphilus]EEG76105.1 Flp/Fap pilin component [Dethiobacter alkaliphilus AHT 1]
MKEMVRRFFTEESGQGMTEYALILALVSIVAIGALFAMGGRIEEIFEQITGSFSGEGLD